MSHNTYGALVPDGGADLNPKPLKIDFRGILYKGYIINTQ